MRRSALNTEAQQLHYVLSGTAGNASLSSYEATKKVEPVRHSTTQKRQETRQLQYGIPMLSGTAGTDRSPLARTPPTLSRRYDTVDSSREGGSSAFSLRRAEAQQLSLLDTARILEARLVGHTHTLYYIYDILCEIIRRVHCLLLC